MWKPQDVPCTLEMWKHFVRQPPLSVFLCLGNYLHFAGQIYIYILLYYVYVPWWNYFSRKFAGHTDTPIIYMIDKIMLSSQNVPIQQSIETSAWCVSKKIPSYIIPFANYQLYIPNGIIIPPTIHGIITHPLCFMVNLLNTTHDSW